MTYQAPPFTKPGTLKLEDAAELMGLSQRRLVEARAGVPAWRVASAVWGFTVPYSKGWEAAFVGRLEALTGMDNRAVRRAIKACAEAGAIEWEPNRWIPPKGEAGRPSLIGLPGAPKVKTPANKAGSSTPGREEPDSITKSLRHYVVPIESESLEGGEPRSPSAETGTPKSGTPHEGRAPALEELPRAELERQAFRATKAGDRERLEAIRLELHRRDVSGSALARFGERGDHA